MGYRNPNPRLAKIHRSYSVDDVSRLFKIHKNTVRNWLRQGLEPIDAQRPTLIRGQELQHFLAERVISRSLVCGVVAISRFETYTRYKDFKAFHIEQAKAFKRDLRSEERRV